MTPHFIPIYASSILAVGTLALFARHNRKTGWTKQSGKLALWLKAFYEGAYADRTVLASAPRETSQPAIPNWTPLTDSDVLGFSRELISLRSSLGTAGNAPVLEAPRVTREMVHQ
jgi:hypothetical protein